MGVSDVLQLAGQFGPMGLLVAYLVWRDLRAEKLEEKRVDADRALAANLALLTAAINGMIGRAP